MSATVSRLLRMYVPGPVHEDELPDLELELEELEDELEDELELELEDECGKFEPSPTFDGSPGRYCLHCGAARTNHP